ncbi:MAG: ABC transporter ATP-binding protein [Rhodospirillales bacterium]
MSVLSLKKVKKAYRQGSSRLEVLKGIDLDIAPSESVALMAPSGAGKTTLLQIAGLLDRPEEGDVFFGDERASDKSDAERSILRSKYIGFIFQFHCLLPEFTAEENVVLPQRIVGTNKLLARDKARGLLEMMGLQGRLNHRPSALSGGEQQRVAIARALANDPKLILADEPTGNLDVTTGKEVADILISRVREAGVGMLVATHNPEFAAQMDRKVYLESGFLT